MLLEWFEWLFTQGAPHARRMGYSYEAIAMQARLSRCSAAWQSHLQHSQQWITDCVQQQSKGGAVLVLGSGLGADLPMATLIDHFDQVYLVDMVHVRRVRRQWANHKQVQLIEADITGSLAALAHGQLTVTQPTRWLEDTSIRCVISANILGQLPVLPLAWLVRHYPQISEAQRIDWAQQVVAQHWQYLQAFRQVGAQVCLIADQYWQWHSSHGCVTEDACWGVELPAAHRQWLWEIAPKGELHALKQQMNQVGAWCW